MFELYLARVPAADLNGQIHRHCIARSESSPARLMPFIVLVFALFVAGCIALARMAAPAGHAALLAAVS
jgi:hypothetical protein